MQKQQSADTNVLIGQYQLSARRPIIGQYRLLTDYRCICNFSLFFLNLQVSAAYSATFLTHLPSVIWHFWLVVWKHLFPVQNPGGRMPKRFPVEISDALPFISRPVWGPQMLLLTTVMSHSCAALIAFDTLSPSMTEADDVFGRICLSLSVSVCLCVCLSCPCSNFWKPWPSNFIFAGTSAEYVGQVHI